MSFNEYTRTCLLNWQLFNDLLRNSINRFYSTFSSLGLAGHIVLCPPDFVRRIAMNFYCRVYKQQTLAKSHGSKRWKKYPFAVFAYWCADCHAGLPYKCWFHAWWQEGSIARTQTNAQPNLKCSKHERSFNHETRLCFIAFICILNTVNYNKGNKN